MELRLDFKVGVKEQLAYYELANGVDPLARPDRMGAAYACILCVLGMLTAYKAQSGGLFVIFLAVMCAIVVQSRRRSRRHSQAVAKTLADDSHHHVTLTINDAGLREVTEGVESFAPWSAVKSYCKFKNVFIVELAPGTASVIPQHALEGVESELLSALESKSVRERVPGASHDAGAAT